MTDTNRLIRCMALITVEFTPGFDWVHVAKCLVFCVVLCRSLFVPVFFLTFLSLTIVLSILLRFTASKYTFCNKAFLIGIGGRRGRDCMVVGFLIVEVGKENRPPL